jgi:hypothetical protein
MRRSVSSCQFPRNVSKANAPSDTAEEVIRIIIQAMSDTDIQNDIVRNVVVDSDVEEHRRLFVIFKAIREQAEKLRVHGCVLSHFQAQRDRLSIKHEFLARRFGRQEREFSECVCSEAGRTVKLYLLTETPAVNIVESGADLNEFAQRGAHMYLDMIFRDGFYHADPHPGNLLLLEGGVVGVLDCGMIGRIDEQLREDFEDMLLAAVDRNADDLTEYVIRLGPVPPEFNRDALRSEIGEFISDFGGQSIEEFDVSGALNGMTNIIRRYGIILPSSCSMLLKVLVMLEGTSRQLDPKFSLAELIKPYYGKVARRRYSPQKLLNRTRRTLRDWDRLIDVLPRDLADILRRVRQGSFDVNLQHRRLDSTINRLVLGIITAALFLGSTALWSRDARPLIGGVSLFGALGSVVALVLGIHLLLAIKKSGSINSDK